MVMDDETVASPDFDFFPLVLVLLALVVLLLKILLLLLVLDHDLLGSFREDSDDGLSGVSISLLLHLRLVVFVEVEVIIRPALSTLTKEFRRCGRSTERVRGGASDAPFDLDDPCRLLSCLFSSRAMRNEFSLCPRDGLLIGEGG